MIKKILPCLMSLCLIFNISVMAANSTDSTGTETPAVSEQMPMQGGGRQGGGRGGMGMPPSNAIQNGETPPAMPDGKIPRGEMPPSGNSEIMVSNDNQQPPQTNEENIPNDWGNENINRMPGGGMGGQGGMNSDIQVNTQNTDETSETQSQGGIMGFVKNYSTPIISVILLILAFVFVIFYKRKRY